MYPTNKQTDLLESDDDSVGSGKECDGLLLVCVFGFWVNMASLYLPR